MGEKKAWFFPPTRFLQNILIEVSYGHDFFYRHKEQGQADPPDTLNIVVKLTENFLEAFEKKFQLKTWGFLRIFYLALSFISQNLNFCRFSWHIIRLVRRTVTICLPTQRTRLSRLPRYLERFGKDYRKSSRGIWKKVSTQNTRFCQNILTWFWASFFMFWAETFFL